MQTTHAFASARARRLVLSVLVAAGLGACVAQDKTELQCEPGVADLSRTATVAPTTC